MDTRLVSQICINNKGPLLHLSDIVTNMHMLKRQVSLIYIHELSSEILDKR
jgi:phage FluMu protein gp41